jgi:hypothetical protein
MVEANRRRRALAAAILIAAAFALRFPSFGGPYIHGDEGFYLFVGDRLLHGELPYVDIWDRKPIGLFLIYAGIRLLGGEGIVQYQLVAAAFAAAGALVVAGLAGHRAGWRGAVAAGFVYLAFLQPFGGGGGGQAQVFFNPLVAGAALLTLKAWEQGDAASVLRFGMGAMALCGLALQIKYSVVVEGCLFGLVLTWLAWARGGIGKAALWAALFSLIALAPTLCALAAYAVAGHAEAFWFANFTSILRRAPSAAIDMPHRLAAIGIPLVPLAAAAAAGLAIGRSSRAPAERLTLAWALAAALGIAVMGTFYDNYALTVIAPLAVAAAALFERRWLGPAAAALAIVWALVAAGWPGPPVARTRSEMAGLTALTRSHLNGGCLWLVNAPAILQYETGACAPSRFVFPYQLSLAVETDALGVDPAAETRRILATRPTVIVAGEISASLRNPAVYALVQAALARDYWLVGTLPLRGGTYRVYALNPPR